MRARGARVTFCELELAVEQLVEVAEVVERRHLVGDAHLPRALEEPHVLEGEGHRVGEGLHPRESPLVERVLGLGAQSEKADAAVPGVERQNDVGADPLLEQPHVLDEAVGVDEVVLEDRLVVEDDEARARTDDGDDAAEAPRRSVGVARPPRGSRPTR